MKTKKELQAELKLATRDIKDLCKQKRASSFKHLSGYSKNLFKEEYQKAVGKQMDIIMAIVELGLPESEMTKLVNTATK